MGTGDGLGRHITGVPVVLCLECRMLPRSGCTAERMRVARSITAAMFSSPSQILMLSTRYQWPGKYSPSFQPASPARKVHRSWGQRYPGQPSRPPSRSGCKNQRSLRVAQWIHWPPSHGELPSPRSLSRRRQDSVKSVVVQSFRSIPQLNTFVLDRSGNLIPQET